MPLRSPLLRLTAALEAPETVKTLEPVPVALHFFLRTLLLLVATKLSDLST